MSRLLHIVKCTTTTPNESVDQKCLVLRFFVPHSLFYFLSHSLAMVPFSLLYYLGVSLYDFMQSCSFFFFLYLHSIVIHWIISNSNSSSQSYTHTNKNFLWNCCCIVGLCTHTYTTTSISDEKICIKRNIENVHFIRITSSLCLNYISNNEYCLPMKCDAKAWLHFKLIKVHSYHRGDSGQEREREIWSCFRLHFCLCWQYLISSLMLLSTCDAFIKVCAICNRAFKHVASSAWTNKHNTKPLGHISVAITNNVSPYLSIAKSFPPSKLCIYICMMVHGIIIPCYKTWFSVIFDLLFAYNAEGPTRYKFVKFLFKKKLVE